MATLKCIAHHIGVTRAVKAVIGSAASQVDQMFDQVADITEFNFFLQGFQSAGLDPVYLNQSSSQLVVFANLQSAPLSTESESGSGPLSGSSSAGVTSLMAAPLFYSGDMRYLDEFTLNLLCNHEVIAIDQEHAARGEPSVRRLREHAVAPRDRELRVREELEAQPERLRESRVALRRVGADRQDLHTAPLQSLVLSTEALHLVGSAGREVLRVEGDQDVLLTAEGGQRHVLAPGVLQGEVRSRVAHAHPTGIHGRKLEPVRRSELAKLVGGVCESVSAPREGEDREGDEWA